MAGASAYPRVIDFARFGAIAAEVGAVLVVDMAHVAGLVAAGLHPSPVPHAALVTSTTHKTLRGPRGGVVLAQQEWAEKLDKSMFPGLQGGPLMHVIAAKAVCFGEALTEGFVAYQQRVVENARILGETLVDCGFDLVSGGTDNHLLLVDLRRRNLTGKAAEEALHHARITVNKNAVPDDPQKPWVTSGIRIGTPALTTRGMGADEMRLIGRLDRPRARRPCGRVPRRRCGARGPGADRGLPALQLDGRDPPRRHGGPCRLSGRRGQLATSPRASRGGPGRMCRNDFAVQRWHRTCSLPGHASRAIDPRPHPCSPNRSTAS